MTTEVSLKPLPPLFHQYILVIDDRHVTTEVSLVLVNLHSATLLCFAKTWVALSC